MAGRRTDAALAQRSAVKVLDSAKRVASDLPVRRFRAVQGGPPDSEVRRYAFAADCQPKLRSYGTGAALKTAPGLFGDKSRRKSEVAPAKCDSPSTHGIKTGGPVLNEEHRAVKAGDHLLSPDQDYHRPCGLNY